jgi:formate-dependent nitrite reductase membrane component NrfD
MNVEHGAHFSPDAVSAGLSRNGDGFGRAQQNYYDHPVLQKAHWRWEIELYFYVGGMAGGSALLSLLAERSPAPEDAPLVRNGRYLAMLGAALSGALLIKDLGRPERFLNMLRIVKLKSPMSVGVWTLQSFAITSGLAVANQLKRDGILPFDVAFLFPKVLRDLILAASSAMMASYTSVLISATAIPVWYRGRCHIPPIFVASAASTSCALNAALLALTGGSPQTIRKLERLEAVAALTEAAFLLDYERHAGETGAPLFRGPVGQRLKTWTMLAGIAAPLALNLPAWISAKPAKSHVANTLLASALTLAGGYVLRRCFIEAGRGSADDPRAVLQTPS